MTKYRLELYVDESEIDDLVDPNLDLAGDELDEKTKDINEIISKYANNDGELVIEIDTEKGTLELLVKPETPADNVPVLTPIPKMPEIPLLTPLLKKL
jgi:hypothetical protein